MDSSPTLSEEEEERRREVGGGQALAPEQEGKGLQRLTWLSRLSSVFSLFDDVSIKLRDPFVFVVSAPM